MSRRGGAGPRAESRAAVAGGAPRQEAGGPETRRDSSAGYFTRVDMQDFQPAGEVKIRIVSRGGTDER